ncbi:hypothetical protein MMC17_003530 [Xylographa soralifera]|nr:hypothetical protein [Xylographa soralifera]
MVPAHTKHTFAYKHVQGKPIELDVYVADPRPTTPMPLMLYFHGGYIISGSRGAVRPWLLKATLRRHWTFVSADYRVLPESTGHDLLADLRSAYAWVATELNTHFPNLVDPSRLIVAGSSGGGYCAVLGGAQFHDPVPKAVWALYPVVDPAAERWITPGIPLPDVKVEDAGPTLKEIEERRSNGEVSFGETFPKDGDMSRHKRYPYLRFILQEGLFADYVTGVKGFGDRVRKEGRGKVITEEMYELFPLDFGITREYPPLVVVHGTKDRGVSVEESEKLVERVQAVGGTVDYFAVEGRDHTFDFTVEDCEEGEGRDAGAQALEGSLKALDGYVGGSVEDR